VVKRATSRTALMVESVGRSIYVIRGQKVMLDSVLAEIYGVSTRRLNEQVRRNRHRFPADFMFRLTKNEADPLRSQNATLKTGRGTHRKYLPYAFTEHGAVMQASILSSPRAIEASIFVVRAFVRLREYAATHKELAAKISELERKVGSHDESIRSILAVIRQLMAAPEPRRRQIGFHKNTMVTTQKRSPQSAKK